MTWYQWLIGGAEFAITWWATDALTSPQARARRSEQRAKSLERHERIEARERGKPSERCITCNRVPVAAFEYEGQLWCSICYHKQMNNPFSRYESPPVYGALSAVQGVLGAKATNLAEEYMKTVLRTQMRLR